MNERVFTQKVVGDYFKKHFIPLKVDMEKGEGIALRKKFDVNAFPTMFILDAEGNIVGKLQGARDTDKFWEMNNFGSLCTILQEVKIL